jgi:hypothetical protein
MMMTGTNFNTSELEQILKSFKKTPNDDQTREQQRNNRTHPASTSKLRT